MDAAAAATDRADPAQRLMALGRGYVRFALANKAVFQLMFDGDVEPEKNERLASAGKAAYLRLTDGIDGLTPGRSPAAKQALTDLAWSSVHGYAMLLLGGQLDHDDPADPAFDRRLNSLLEGVIAAGSR
jgi:hypothetical protein